jgi:hypothetical protein
MLSAWWSVVLGVAIVAAGAAHAGARSLRRQAAAVDRDRARLAALADAVTAAWAVGRVRNR